MLRKGKLLIASLMMGMIVFTSTVGQAANVSYNSPSRYSGRGYSIRHSFYDNYTRQNYNYNWQVITLPIRISRPSTPSIPVKPSEPTTPSVPVEPSKPTRPTKPVEPSKPVEEEKPTAPSTPNVSGLSELEMEVVRLVNIERQKAGLKPFTASAELSKVARAKSEDMARNNYFSHTSPTYGSPFDMMRSFGISYRTAGENIAKGYSSAQSVVNGWMNSSGHRANILNPSFNTIGVGAYKASNGTIYWTQMFTD